MKRFRVFRAVATALCILSRQAAGSTLQEAFDVRGLNFLTANTITTSIRGFNPSLGTLTGVSVTYDSAAVLLQGNAISSRIIVNDPMGNQVGTINFPNMTGRDEQVRMGGFPAPAADISDFENSADISLSFEGTTACRGSAPTLSGCFGFSGEVTGQVNYSYGAMANAPEPRSFELFVGGVILAFLGTRLRAARDEEIRVRTRRPD